MEVVFARAMRRGFCGPAVAGRRTVPLEAVPGLQNHAIIRVSTFNPEELSTVEAPGIMQLNSTSWCTQANHNNHKIIFCITLQYRASEYVNNTKENMATPGDQNHQAPMLQIAEDSLTKPSQQYLNTHLPIQ